MQANMTAQLVADALMMAIWRRGKPDMMLHHSDQGSQSPASSSSACWPITALTAR
jgi:transposase InsO family protein